MRIHFVPLSIFLACLAGCCCPGDAPAPATAPADAAAQPAELVVPELPPRQPVAGAPAPVSEPARHVQDWLAASDRALETRTHATAEHAVASRAMQDAESALRGLAAKDAGKVTRVFDLLIGELRESHAATEGRLHQLQREARRHSPDEEAWIRTAPAKLEAIEKRIATLSDLKTRVLER